MSPMSPMSRQYLCYFYLLNATVGSDSVKIFDSKCSDFNQSVSRTKSSFLSGHMFFVCFFVVQEALEQKSKSGALRTNTFISRNRKE